MSAEDGKATKKKSDKASVRAADTPPAADAPKPAKKAARKRASAPAKAGGTVPAPASVAVGVDVAPAPASVEVAPSESVAAPTAPPPHGEPIASDSSDHAAARPLLLRTRLDVRWGDMDAFNHVNNAVFLTYLEEARLRWLQALPGPWLDDNTAPLLAAANVNYRRPIEWPSRVSVELYADRVGNSSLTIGHRVLDAQDPAIVYSDGHTVMVWIDRRNGKASRLPHAVRQACTSGVTRDRGNG